MQKQKYSLNGWMTRLQALISLTLTALLLLTLTTPTFTMPLLKGIRINFNIYTPDNFNHYTTYSQVHSFLKNPDLWYPPLGGPLPSGTITLSQTSPHYPPGQANIKLISEGDTPPTDTLTFSAIATVGSVIVNPIEFSVSIEEGTVQPIAITTVTSSVRNTYCVYDVTSNIGSSPAIVSLYCTDAS